MKLFWQAMTLTTGLNPLDASRVLANQTDIIRRSRRAVGLDGSALSQLVLLQMPQHVLYTLQVGSSRTSRRRSRAVAWLTLLCSTHLRRCPA